MFFRLLTYNIHKGIGGVDRLYRPERIVETLRHYHADIVLLQEVDDGVPRSRRDRQVDLLGDALELPHRAFQRNVTLREGYYGNAILSRYPISDIEHLELTVPLKKRRRALAVRCHLHEDGHTRSLVVLNTHLGLAGFERRIQLRRILAHHAVTHLHQSTAVVLAGDMNDVWGNLGKRILEPAGFTPVMGPANTYPAVMPMRPLDRIYYRGQVEMKHAFVCRSEVSRYASDHRPLIAEFELPVLPDGG